MSKLIACILSNIQIRIEDFQFRYVTTSRDIGIPDKNYSIHGLVVKIESLSLINTDQDWKLAFYEHTDGGRSTRKLLSVSNVIVYVEGTNHGVNWRNYMIQHCHATVKATLYYQNSSCIVPDVQVDVDLSARKKNCSSENTIAENQIDEAVTPLIVIHDSHIDMCCMILQEMDISSIVYNSVMEYEGMSSTNNDKSVSNNLENNSGLALVLMYSKHWLLSDCVDGLDSDDLLSGSNLRKYYGDDGDDDDDEFEDAISPSVFSSNLCLANGVDVLLLFRCEKECVVINQPYEKYEIADEILAPHWKVSFGKTMLSFKQTVVEHEVNLEIDRFNIMQLNQMHKSLNLLHHSFECSYFVKFRCVIPAYESRRVGYQPIIAVDFAPEIKLQISPSTFRLYSLLKPLLDWYEIHQANMPTTQRLTDDHFAIAPLPDISFALSRLECMLLIKDSIDDFILSGTENCNNVYFGIAIEDCQGKTEQTDTSVESACTFERITFFSVGLVDKNRNLICEFKQPFQIIISSASRSAWLKECHNCQHQYHYYSTTSEAAAYNPCDGEQGKKGLAVSPRVTEFTDNLQQNRSTFYHRLSKKKGQAEKAMYEMNWIWPEIGIRLTVGELDALCLFISSLSTSFENFGCKNNETRKPVSPVKLASPSVLNPLSLVKQEHCKMHINSIFPSVSFSLLWPNEFGVALKITKSTACLNVCTRVIELQVKCNHITMVEEISNNILLSVSPTELLPHEDYVLIEYARFPRTRFHLTKDTGADKATNVTTHVGGVSYGRMKMLSIRGGQIIVHWKLKSWRTLFEQCRKSSRMVEMVKEFGLLHATSVNIKTPSAQKQNAFSNSATEREISQLFCQVFVQMKEGICMHLYFDSQDCSEPVVLATATSGLSQAVLHLYDSTSHCEHCRSYDVRASLKQFRLVDATLTLLPSSPTVSPVVISCLETTTDTTNDVDILFSEKCFHTQDFNGFSPLCQVRLDSVAILYTHRFLKEIKHYLTHYFFSIFYSSLSEQDEHKELKDLKAFLVTLGYQVHSHQRLCSSNNVDSAAGNSKRLCSFKLEIVALDLKFSIPRNTFRHESIVLQSSFAKFWSTFDPSLLLPPKNDSTQVPEHVITPSFFLQNGMFMDESFAKEKQRRQEDLFSNIEVKSNTEAKRTEWRGLRRLVQKQRSHLLNYHSQVILDLKNATRQAEIYQHEGYDIPEAEEAIGILHQKLRKIQEQLLVLDEYRTSIQQELISPSSNGLALMKAIQIASRDFTHIVAEPLYHRDDAAFHDASLYCKRQSNFIVDKQETTLPQWDGFQFEIIDLCVKGSDDFHMVHHAFVNGKVHFPLLEEQYLKMKDKEMQKEYIEVSINLKELKLEASAAQYDLLIGVICENFKEQTILTKESEFDVRCPLCRGHHYANQYCKTKWLQIPINAADASLHLIPECADFQLEQLSVEINLFTSDEIEIIAQSQIFSIFESLKKRNVAPLTAQPTGRKPAPIYTSNRATNEILIPLEMLRNGGGSNNNDDNGNQMEMNTPHQIRYHQRLSYSGSTYEIVLQDSSIVMLMHSILKVVSFFSGPFLIPIDEYSNMIKANPCLSSKYSNLMEDKVSTKLNLVLRNCSFCLVEEFDNPISRALIIKANFEFQTVSYSILNSSEYKQEQHFTLEQKGVYFTTFPHLQIDTMMPLVNSFVFSVNHVNEVNPCLPMESQCQRKIAVALHPIEGRVSMHDCLLLQNIFSNLQTEFLSSSGSATPTSFTEKSNSMFPQSIDLLGQIGNIRIILVNNNLGVPIVDVGVSSILLEFHRSLEDNGSMSSMGCTLSSNYFNNSIYRWEPLLEPFAVQARLITDEKKLSIVVQFPDPVNLNLTHAMAPLLSLETLQETSDFISGENTIPPFRLLNSTGGDIRYSFRRGAGSSRLVRGTLGNTEMASLDCRSENLAGNLASFDTTSADIFAEAITIKDQLTANHSLYVSMNNGKWISCSPVTVDVVGHCCIPLKYCHNPKVANEQMAIDDAEESRLDMQKDNEIKIPTLVAEITLQEDGSKIIELHSQVIIQNLLPIPLCVWMFCPSEGGNVKEWVVANNEVCHVPLELVHPESKISIKPARNVHYAPLTRNIKALEKTTLQQVQEIYNNNNNPDQQSGNSKNNDKKEAKNKKRIFIQSGNCLCATLPTNSENCRVEEKYLSNEMVVRELPVWQCSYDVEAFPLLNANTSSMEEIMLDHAVNDDIDNNQIVGNRPKKKVENDIDLTPKSSMFNDLLSPPLPSGSNLHHSIHHHLHDINSELKEAVAAQQNSLKSTNAENVFSSTVGSVKKNSSKNPFHFVHLLTIKPLVSLYNRLAGCMAYRILNSTLQLIAEGMIPVGENIPLYQVNQNEKVYISIRLPNYNWSQPYLFINPKETALTIPFKDRQVGIILTGQKFNSDSTRDIFNNNQQQSDVPDLRVELKWQNRDLIVYCKIWLVNHSGLTLHYSNSANKSLNHFEQQYQEGLAVVDFSKKNKKKKTVLKPFYVHRRPKSNFSSNNCLSACSSTRSYASGQRSHSARNRKAAIRNHHTHINSGRNKLKHSRNTFFNSECDFENEEADQENLDEERAENDFFSASQMLDESDDASEEREDIFVATHTKRPIILERSAAIFPVALLVIVHEARDLYNCQYFGQQSPYVVAKLVTTRNSKHNLISRMDETKPCPGGGIRPKWSATLHNTLYLKLPNFNDPYYDLESCYILIEVLNTRYGMESCLGRLRIPVYRILEDPSKAATAARWYPLYKYNQNNSKKDLIYQQDRFSTSTVPSSSFSLDDNVNGNIRRGEIALSFTVGSQQQLPDGIDNQHENSQQEVINLPGTKILSPQKHNDNKFASSSSPPFANCKTKSKEALLVYLPTNRFWSIKVMISYQHSLHDVLRMVCKQAGMGELHWRDYFFCPLLLPRFVSLRSAGRPEAERWYGSPLSWSFPIGKELSGSSIKKNGLLLSHRLSMVTLRAYDELTTASIHHMTPRAGDYGVKKCTEPWDWEEILMFGAVDKNPSQSKQKQWEDVVRVRVGYDSVWSDIIHLQRNAMGNSGLAQVLQLAQTSNNGRDNDGKVGNRLYELSLWTTYGVGYFSDTIVATLLPRYVFINRTAFSIGYAQAGDRQHIQVLHPGELQTFHWRNKNVAKKLTISFVDNELDQWTWSGFFSLNSIGTTYAKLRKCNHLESIYILQCQIDVVGGGTILVVFREEMKRWPPYRIDNMTSFRLRYKQKGWKRDGGDLFDELAPRSSCPYSWDVLDHLNTVSVASNSSSEIIHDPSTTDNNNSSLNTSSNSSTQRFVSVHFMQACSNNDSNVDSTLHNMTSQVQDYNLDQMTIHKSMRLQRSLPSFTNCTKEGYLYKRDNFLKKKWNKRYFRLHQTMLYYFMNDHDWELHGVIDLSPNLDSSSYMATTSVLIYEHSKINNTSTNSGGVVDTVTKSLTSLFNSSGYSSNIKQQRINYMSLQEVDSYIDRLLWISVRLQDEFEELKITGKGVVDFLLDEGISLSRQEAIHIAKDMLQVGMLRAFFENTDRVSESQQEIKINSCSPKIKEEKASLLKEKTEFARSEEEEDEEEDEDEESLHQFEDKACRIFILDPSVDRETLVLHPSLIKSSTTKANPRKLKKKDLQFSIETRAKVYDLRAESDEVLKTWLYVLRAASRNNNSSPIKHKLASTMELKLSTEDVASTKTYIVARIRADGPTKVLELTEIGSEEVVENAAGMSAHNNSTTIRSEEEMSGSNLTLNNNAEEKGSVTTQSWVHWMSLEINMHSIGISCVNEVPMELVYICFGGIHGSFSSLGRKKFRLSVTFDNVQADNQTPNTTFPTLICPRPTKSIYSTSNMMTFIPDNYQGVEQTPQVFRCADCDHKQTNEATLHFCMAWTQEPGSTDYFEHCSFWMYPMVIQLDEELLVLLQNFANTFYMEHSSKRLKQSRIESLVGDSNLSANVDPEPSLGIKSTSTTTLTNVVLPTRPADLIFVKEILRDFIACLGGEEFDPLTSLNSMTLNEQEQNQKRNIYFALLHIHPMEFEVTFRSDAYTSSNLDDVVVVDNSFLHVPDLDMAPIRVNALMIEHAFGSSSELARRVTKHYTRQWWRQFHKVLGSFDFLGNPVGFLDHLGTGVRDFFYEPLEGLKVGSKGFRTGLAKGTSSLVSNTLDGTFDAASKISGTFGSGLATMSLDDHYQFVRARARRTHVSSIQQGVKQGAVEFGLGVYEGLSGIVMTPYRGARNHGMLGLMKGTVAGIIGVPIKPVAGLFDFASRASQGVRNRAMNRLTGGELVTRIRPPRVFGRYKQLRIYKIDDAISQELLRKTSNGKLVNEQMLFYFEVLQSVNAKEATMAARKRSSYPDHGHHRSRSINVASESHTSTTISTTIVKQHSTLPRKSTYEIRFERKALGLTLETDFYCENVAVKAFDASNLHAKIVSINDLKEYSGDNVNVEQLIQEDDILVAVGGVSVEGLSFKETMAILRGASRPVVIRFESYSSLSHLVTNSKNSYPVFQPPPPTASATIVTWEHWVLVTEERVIYINVGDFNRPEVEWTTPVRYISHVERIQDNTSIAIHLSVGVNSLPTGPLLLPTAKQMDSHNKDMERFMEIMWASFKSPLAEEQELWPSEMSLNGYMLKKGALTSSKRWFVLSRNCLYYFNNDQVNTNQLRGIVPLGSVHVSRDLEDCHLLRITNRNPTKSLSTIQMENNAVCEREQKELLLVCPDAENAEMWYSCILHAAGKGMRHSKGTRFYPSSEATVLYIGCKETPHHVVAALFEALRKTIDMLGRRRISSQ